MTFGDPTDQPHPLQIAAFKRMTPWERLQMADAARATAVYLIAGWIRTREPDLDDAAVEARVRRRFLRG